MTADAVSSAAAAAKISPRKQRQSKPLAETFFGHGSSSRTPAASQSAILSSSPAFATPLHPIRPGAGAGGDGGGAAAVAAAAAAAAAKPAILPILLPPATLRPLAFRTFTKKHSLTLTSSALQELATFIGRHCGSGWREEGLAERVLEETAKSWKNRNCGFIVDGASAELKDILKTLEGNMSGGRIVAGGAGGAGGAGAGAGAGTGAARRGPASALADRRAREGLPRENSLLLDTTREEDINNARLGLRPTAAGAAGGLGRPLLAREDSQASLGLSGLDVADDDGGARGDDVAAGAGPNDDDDDGDEEGLLDPRQWLKVVGAFDQPRLAYNVAKKHFERETSKPSLLPSTAHKTALFRNRFNVVHQRLLRNELFQTSAVAEARAVRRRLGDGNGHGAGAATHKITPVANLLGRHGSHHMLLGMLVVLPTGSLAICDLSASIVLDLSSAVAIPEDSAWFAPGMLVLVDGVYEEEEEAVAGRGLNGATGVGGTIGGRFQAFFIGQPPSETRRAALGISGPDGGSLADGGGGADHTIGGGFGWIDFLGVGSHRAVGARMRKLEQRLLLRQLRQQRQRQQAGGDAVAQPTALPAPAPPSRQRVVLLGELSLDQPRTLQALRKVLGLYAAEPEGAAPVAFVLTGNFAEHAVMARGGSGGSIEYKEYFDGLAAALGDYPALLQAATFVFVPGDNDGWVSAFGGGAAVPLPRKPVPDLFTSRVRRVFAAANAEAAAGVGSSSSSSRVRGEAVWTTNPSRLSLFGPNHEIVLFRDDISGRLRRTAVRLAKSGGAMEVDGGAGEPAPGAVVAAGAGAADALPHDVRTARKLVKTLLDQGYLAPFRTSLRPVHWDFAGALHLYPLPTALMLVDTTAPPFCVTYEGCHVMNPGSLLVAGRRGAARWIEYDLGRTGRLRECTF